MKNYLTSIIIALVLFGCSSESSNEENYIDGTFLENHQGTKWYASNENGHVYQRFLNSVVSPLEVWLFFNTLNPDNCYLYGMPDFSNPEPGETLEITLNDGDVFEYRHTYPSGDSDVNISIVTHTITGNTMSVEEKHYTNGTQDLDEIVTWTRSSDNVDGLTICN